MTDPTRLIDEAGGDELEGSLLRLARREGPSDEGRRKILAAIAAASATTTVTQGAKAASSAKGLTVAKWGLVALAGVGVATALLLRSAPEAGPRAAVPTALKAPATEVRPASAPPRAEAPAPVALEDLPTLPQKAASASTPPNKSVPQASLADEVAQLQKAKLALKSGNAGRALAELGTYSQRFARPMLGSEATVLRIEALHQSGDAARAKSLAESFLAKNPSSPYAARLRSLTAAR